MNWNLLTARSTDEVLRVTISARAEIDPTELDRPPQTSCGTLTLKIGLATTERAVVLSELSIFLLAAWLLMVAAGTCVGMCAIPFYRNSRRRRLDNSLLYHHRGLALRSFISPWDDPRQSIYRTCRLSSRLANVHDLQLLVMIGCFALAGCFSALVHHELFVGEILCVVSVIAMIFQWPTCRSFVRWCGSVIDPLCASKAEYVES